MCAQKRHEMHKHDVHIAFYARGQFSSAKQVFRFRKMVTVFSLLFVHPVPNVNK